LSRLCPMSHLKKKFGHGSFALTGTVLLQSGGTEQSTDLS